MVQQGDVKQSGVLQSYLDDVQRVFDNLSDSVTKNSFGFQLIIF